MRKGRLYLYLGCMRSQKSKKLLERVREMREYGKRKVLLIKPTKDTRSGQGTIKSRDGESLPATEIPGADIWQVLEVIETIERDNGELLDCVAIDEGQFFDDLYALVEILIKRRYEVIVAGLDLDFRARPFRDVPNLTVLAADDGGEIHWCTAYCTKCGNAASRSLRLINGQPASWNSPLDLPGGDETYECRCTDHFPVPDCPYPPKR